MYTASIFKNREYHIYIFSFRVFGISNLRYFDNNYILILKGKYGKKIKTLKTQIAKVTLPMTVGIT